MSGGIEFWMRETNTSFDLLFVGHFAVDQVIVDGVSETLAGGGVYYGGVAAARLGARVGVVTRLAAAHFPLLDEMRRAGVAVFAAEAPETSGIANYYDSADMERRVCVPLGFAGPIQPADLPWNQPNPGPSDLAARIYAITPIIAGEVGLTLLNMLADRGPVALDIQGFVRVRVGSELLFRAWPQMAEGLARVTYLKVDRAEAEALTGETDLAAAARILAGYGPREIVLTQSAGVTVYADGEIFTAPFTPRSLAGRTGRGDTCFATYLTKRLTTTPAEACRWAGIVTTQKQEQPGPWRGSTADLQAARP